MFVLFIPRYVIGNPVSDFSMIIQLFLFAQYIVVIVSIFFS